MKYNSLLDSLSAEELTSISQRIKYLRTDILQMTQSEFANAANISQSYLSFLERGERDVNISFITNISSSLKINLDWLIYGIGDDSNIFASQNITKERLIKDNQEYALSESQKAYSLKTNDLDFLKWYLSLSKSERQHFVEATNTISKLMK